MSWLENLIGATQSAAGRKPSSQAVSQQQLAREQQAVLNQLRAGKGITGARPANPIIGGIQTLFGGAGAGTIPTLNAAKLGGQEVLMNRGGWDTRVAGSGPINVGGQTWYPAQSGQDLVYKRAPGKVGGQYGSIFSADQLTSPAEPGNQPPDLGGPSVQPPAKLSPEEQAYNAERSRIAQLTAQNPEFQNIGQLRNDLRDQGMQIWQQKYGNTPMGQPGGAVGRFNPLMERTFGYQAGMSPQQMQEMQATAAPVPVAPGEIPYQQGDLGTRATLETGYDPAQYGLSPNLVEEMKKRLLQQAGK